MQPMVETTKINKTVELFCQFIKALPESSLVDQEWGPKEVLAHLVFHHERYVKLAESWLDHMPCEPLRGKYRQINAQAVAMNRSQSVAALLGRFVEANRRFVQTCTQHNPEKILVEIKSGVKVRTLAELLPEVEAHIRNHLIKLQKAYKIAP